MPRQRKYNCPLSEMNAMDISDNGYFELDHDNHDSEDFYATVSPSENIWKKFELLPTPPLSPEREDCEDQYKINYELEEWLATPLYLDRCGIGLQSQVIQDCMWSGGDEQDSKTRTRTVSLSELSMVATSTSCVDPTAVHSRALNIEHSYSMTGPEPPKMPETPAYTDESESEEEVDVVTVDVSKTTKQPINNTTQFITSLTSGKVKHELSVVAARLSQNSLKRPKCLSLSDQIFYAPSNKKRKSLCSMQGSRSSSDSDDMCFEGKRSQHNVLERQRRNDLKKSLIKLRSQLPSLRSNEKAPKVVILVHATNYIRELHIDDHRLRAEYKELRSKHNSLKQRLDSLQSLIKP